MKNIFLGLLFLGFTTQIYAQDPVVTLDEVTLVNTNYKYLSSTDAEDIPIPVDKLEVKVATFDIKTLDIYTDEYDFYDVYFIIPEGKILATYDKEGKILRTAEKFKKLNLPSPVIISVLNRFPNWDIAKDTYLVKYLETGKTKKIYKLTLKNGEKRIKVKTDDQGNFL